MATELFRKRMIPLYREMRDADMFLAGFFEVRPGNISDTEKVVFDIQRMDEEISPVVNTCEGPTFNVDNVFTTKEFTPPTIQEAMPFDCKELLRRLAGQTEYQATEISWQASLVARILQGMNQLENKIRRNRDWQASQILRTGVLTLVDEFGNPAYMIDYQAKATHFPAAGAAWGGGGDDPLADIEALADVIRNDSLQDADRIIMGAGAWNAFINDSKVQNQLDNRRIEVGRVAPEPRGTGGKFQAVINVGNYRFEIWTYSGRGVIPGSGTKTLFVGDADCIVMASSGRLDTVFGGVPMAVPVDPRFADFLPSRVAVPQAVDMVPNIYATPDGMQTILQIASRPLLIPTAIDSFGNIATGV
jgi:Phage major capsid protein E